MNAVVQREGVGTRWKNDVTLVEFGYRHGAEAGLHETNEKRAAGRCLEWDEMVALLMSVNLVLHVKHYFTHGDLEDIAESFLW